MGADYVFGYGSLSSERRGVAPAVATLRGHERVWDVAMDNRESIPGYKYYLDPVTGERPEVFVTFLDVVAAPSAARGAAVSGCVGFLLPVAGASELVALDRRERNYDRVDVTALITVDPQTPHTPHVPDTLHISHTPDSAATLPDRVWTYVGKPEARERYAAAAARGAAVIQAAYLERVERAFAARGLTERYRASTRPPQCPVRALTRVNDSSRL